MPDVVDDTAIGPDQGFLLVLYLYLGNDFWIVRNLKNLQCVYNKFILLYKYIINVCFFMRTLDRQHLKKLYGRFHLPEPGNVYLHKVAAGCSKTLKRSFCSV
jgi:hypothetical protein